MAWYLLKIFKFRRDEQSLEDLSSDQKPSLCENADNHTEDPEKIDNTPLLCLYSKSGKRIFTGRNELPFIPGVYSYAKQVRILEKKRRYDPQARIIISDIDMAIRRLHERIIEQEQKLSKFQSNRDFNIQHIDRENAMVFPIKVLSNRVWQAVDLLERYDRLMCQWLKYKKAGLLGKELFQEYLTVEKNFRRLFTVAKS